MGCTSAVAAARCACPCHPRCLLNHCLLNHCYEALLLRSCIGSGCMPSSRVSAADRRVPGAWQRSLRRNSEPALPAPPPRRPVPPHCSSPVLLPPTTPAHRRHPAHLFLPLLPLLHGRPARGHAAAQRDAGAGGWAWEQLGGQGGRQRGGDARLRASRGGRAAPCARAGRCSSRQGRVPASRCGVMQPPACKARIIRSFIHSLPSALTHRPPTRPPARPPGAARAAGLLPHLPHRPHPQPLLQGPGRRGRAAEPGGCGAALVPDPLREVWGAADERLMPGGQPSRGHERCMAIAALRRDRGAAGGQLRQAGARASQAGRQAAAGLPRRILQKPNQV